MIYIENDIQTFLKEAGEAGCYSLCLISVASEYLKKKIDVVEALKVGIEKGCIHYNELDPNDDDNFYVNYPARFLELMTGRHWEVRKGEPIHKANKNEFIINRWERVKTGSVIAHFDREDFHPISKSLTVKNGTIKSTRICIVKD